jgi:thioredoxin reductase (NADPH)
VEKLIGSGVYYGSAVGEAAFHRGGDVFIVGGANSAGQPALHLAQYAASVTLVIRGASLEERMSRYLIERLQAHPSISVRARSTVIGAIGERRLEQLVIADEAAGEERTVRADALFIMIGGIPVSERVEGWLRRDEHGFMVTGTDVLEGDVQRRWWPLDREPYLLEGSQPGCSLSATLGAVRSNEWRPRSGRQQSPSSSFTATSRQRLIQPHRQRLPPGPTAGPSRSCPPVRF